MKMKWILLGTLLVGTAVIVYLRLRKSSDFEPLIKTKLIELVHKGSNGLYQLHIEDLEIDVLNSSATVLGVSIIPDTSRMSVLHQNAQLPDDIFSIQISKLYIDGLSAADFINSSTFDLQQIRIDTPNIVVTHQKRNYNTKDTSPFYSRIAPNQESFSIQSLLLNNANLRIVNKDKRGTTSNFNNLSIQLSHVKIEESTLNDSTRFLFAKDANIYLGNYGSITANNQYSFSVDSVALKPQLGSMTIKGLRLKPIDSKTDFNDKLRFQEDRFDIFLMEAEVKNINWWSLLSNNGLFAEAATLNGGYLNVYRDQTLPLSAESRVGRFPHQELMRLQFPIYINELLFKNMTVSYEEFNPKSKEAGKIDFDQVNGNIQNISNIPEVYTRNNLMKINTRSIFMKQAKLEATFEFDLTRTASGDFTVNMLLGKMDGVLLNQITEGLGMIKVEKLLIQQLRAKVNGNNDSATGAVSFAYQDLAVTALKKDNKNQFKKKKFASFIANKYLINSKSDGKSVKEVRFQRDPRKSFFNLIWKTINKGVAATVTSK